jgi:hypothetical protein
MILRLYKMLTKFIFYEQYFKKNLSYYLLWETKKIFIAKLCYYARHYDLKKKL